MRTFLPLLATMIALAVSPSPVAAQAKARNVLLLIADDLGMQVGCYGDKVIRTRHIDALAKRGVRFTQAHAAVSSCSPSRATIYTGLHTHSNGQYGLAHGKHHQETFENVRSLASLLRDAGYYTGIIGKIHVLPDSVYPFEARITDKLKGNRDVVAMAGAARRFLKQRGKRPFCLVMGYSDPHRAAKGFANDLFARDANEVKYDPKDIVVPYYLPDQPEVRQDLAEYYQSISRLDRGVGLMIELLRELGELENTLIIFLSDNGPPFPGSKTTLYRPGVHLPLIISAPTQQHRGHTNDALVSWVDVLPTILDWARVKAPPRLQGRSLLPLLDLEHAKGWDEVYCSHQFHEITMYYPMRAIITRRYKLIVNLAPQQDYPLASDLWGSPSWQGILRRGDKMMGQRSVASFLHRLKEELYDLQSDPKELKNLAADPNHATVLSELRTKLRAWQRATGDEWVILYREEEVKQDKRRN
jgi:N-sulfoglucosamine sulfohydrolase